MIPNGGNRFRKNHAQTLARRTFFELARFRTNICDRMKESHPMRPIYDSCNSGRCCRHRLRHSRHLRQGRRRAGQFGTSRLFVRTVVILLVLGAILSRDRQVATPDVGLRPHLSLSAAFRSGDRRIMALLFPPLSRLAMRHGLHRSDKLSVVLVAVFGVIFLGSGSPARTGWALR